MALNLANMDEVADKLFNDAAHICFQCSRRDGGMDQSSECPPECGALTVLKCARNIVTAVEERDQTFQAA